MYTWFDKPAQSIWDIVVINLFQMNQYDMYRNYTAYHCELSSESMYHCVFLHMYCNNYRSKIVCVKVTHVQWQSCEHIVMHCSLNYFLLQCMHQCVYDIEINTTRTCACIVSLVLCDWMLGYRMFVVSWTWTRYRTVPGITVHSYDVIFNKHSNFLGSPTTGVAYACAGR